MKKIEFYDGSKTYMYPNGEIASPERVQADFPACLLFPHIVETDSAGQVLFALENLAAVASLYDLDSDLSADLATVDTSVQPAILSGDFVQAKSLMGENESHSLGEIAEPMMASEKVDLKSQALPLIAKIENLRNASPAPSIPSAEERIAAALEYQNLLTLPDQEENAELKISENLLIKKNFEQGLWTEQMLDIAVKKGQIASADLAQISK